jgi:hypothetical protein
MFRKTVRRSSSIIAHAARQSCTRSCEALIRPKVFNFVPDLSQSRESADYSIHNALVMMRG